MKTLILVLIVVFSGIYNAVAQDIITLKSGDELKGKIIRLNAKDVVFQPQGVNDTLSMMRDQISKLTYKNGTLIYLAERNFVVDDLNIMRDSMYYKGVYDATANYNGYKAASTGTLVASLVFPFNLIPAIACSATPPKDENMGYPDIKLIENQQYHQGYQVQAHKIKKKKVWKNFAIGTGAFIGLYILTLGLATAVMIY